MSPENEPTATRPANERDPGRALMHGARGADIAVRPPAYLAERVVARRSVGASYSNAIIITHRPCVRRCLRFNRAAPASSLVAAHCHATRGKLDDGDGAVSRREKGRAPGDGDVRGEPAATVPSRSRMRRHDKNRG